MCTRFFIEPESEPLAEIAAAVRNNQLADRFIRAGSAILTSGEIRPTNVIPVIAPNKDGERTVFPMKWGFQIPGRSLIVNARVETADTKPTFREAWRGHRCIVPASWYYEWKHFPSKNGKIETGDKYMIQPTGYSVTWLCGLYRIEDGLPVFVILTREPTEPLREIHDRMPLMFPNEALADWINPKINAENLIPYALTDMMFEKSG